MNDGEAGCTDGENGQTAQCTASAAAIALPQADGQADTRNETDRPPQDQDRAQINLSDQLSSTPETGNGDQAIKLLQTMSQWLEGASCPSTDEALLTGWSARYAEQFDNDGAEEQVDLAPVLGLPNKVRPKKKWCALLSSRKKI